MKISSNPELCSDLFDLCETLLRYSKCWWRFWEQRELAEARLYGETLLEIARSGTYANLDLVMLSLAYGTTQTGMTIRLLTQLRSLRSSSEKDAA